MNCHEVERWLDDGSPEASRAAALAHARPCAHCAAALRAADALEMALVAAPPAAPADFADRVMARVAMAPQVRVTIPVLELLPLLRTFPWWMRLALEPSSVLAALIAAVLVWRGDALFALATGGAIQFAAWLAQAAPPSTAAPPAANPVVTLLLQPTVLTCFVLGAAPLVFMGSRLLYDWSASLVGPHHRRPVAR